jgi:phosphoribosylformylglycinamidine synthase
VRTSDLARGHGGGGAAAADPLGEAVRQQIREFGGNGVGRVSTARIFLIDANANRPQIERVARELLADPIVERAEFVEMNHPPRDQRIEIHLKPGVMDPVAASTEAALRDMGIDVREVRTGRVYFIEGAHDRDLLEQIAKKTLANGVIESVHFEPFIPSEFPAAREYEFQLRHVPLRNLNDDDLKKLSREGHLFLSLAEMKAIQAYYREQSREPTDIELETIAQTWSEHCVHKTLKSAVEVVDESGKIVRTYKNLIKETIFGSTMELMKRRNDGFALSVFKDNAGVIKFDDKDAVCFKVETHNRPSAIEPYGGAATGIGGCIRDIMGTGLSAKPVANTDVFCVGFPDVGASIANRKSQIANPHADSPSLRSCR